MTAPTRAKGRLSIRWRLTVWITLAVTVTLVVTFVSLRLALDEIMYQDVEGDLTENFDSARGRVLILPNPTDKVALEGAIANFPFPVIIRDSEGGFIIGNRISVAPEMRLTPAQSADIVNNGTVLDQDVTLGDDAYRVRSQASEVSPDDLLIFQVGRSTQSIKDVQSALNLVLVGAAAVAVVILAVGYLVARIALQPVEQITRTAAEIEASDLKRRIGARGEPTEVQRLADTFDAMLARLESAFGQQRNFVMDVSHELRTPLTALRGNLDVMLMDPHLAADLRLQLEKMSSEVGRLIRLTSNLLYLAHAEAGREIAQRPVELDDLCLEVVHQAKTLRSDVAVRLEHEERITVSGDRDLLKQLVLNLVDNAMKFSPPGGEVIVSLHERGDAAEVVVADRGPGIPPEQVEQIFERFYRGSTDHSRTVGGAGIGLAISRWIAQVHGGEIRVESNAGEGSRFIVTIPLSREEKAVAAGA